MAGRYQCQECGVIIDFNSSEINSCYTLREKITKAALSGSEWEKSVLQKEQSCPSTPSRYHVGSVNNFVDF